MYEKIYDFENLYKAHKRARLGKRTQKEVIDFELNLPENLTRLSDSLKNQTYEISGYYSFEVFDPKQREIHALHYIDRVVQHSICDEVLAPVLDKKIIYDSAACRVGKGTHFALDRVSLFLRDFYKHHGTDGYFLKCDVRKFFDNIDHEILKNKLGRIFKEPELISLFEKIIDSYEAAPGVGLPLGNQTSQWFANYYLDELDRLVKEKLRIKYYSRYMDDFLLIHDDKNYLRDCLFQMAKCLNENLRMNFNSRTQIFPISNGVNYLGWHIYLSGSGKVIRRLQHRTKYRFTRKLKLMQKLYKREKISLKKIMQIISSHYSHLLHGHTYKLREKALNNFVLSKAS